MKKIILVQGLLAPYRFPIFEELSKKKDWDFEVWFMGKQVKNRKWGEDKLSDYTFKYKFLPGWTVSFGKKDTFPFWINPDVVLQLFRAKPNALLMFGWDSLTSFLAHLTCKLLGIPFILWAGSTVNERSWRRSLTLPVVKLHVKFSNALVAYGTRAKQYLIQLGANKNKIYISTNTVDVENYKNGVRNSKLHKKIRKQYELTSKTVILYYGQMIERKGVLVLVHAFKLLKKRYPDLALFLIGDGPLQADIKEIISRDKQFDIHLLDNPGDKKILDYYAASNIFVLPSKEEVWGLVVNEAMAAGLPVIVSDNAGCSIDLVKEGENGFTFKNQSSDSLAEKIELLLKDKEKMKKMGNRSLQIIQEFTPEKTSKAIVEAILFGLDSAK